MWQPRDGGGNIYGYTRRPDAAPGISANTPSTASGMPNCVGDRGQARCTMLPAPPLRIRRAVPLAQCRMDASVLQEA